MPNENLTRETVTARIRALESQRRDLTQQIRELEATQRSFDWDDLTPMINKCFRRKIFFPADNTRTDTFGYEYAVVIGLPPLDLRRNGDAHINKYQLPAIFFKVAPIFMPFDTTPDDNFGDVFHFDMLFTGDLPAEYRNGAIHNGLNAPFEECTQTDFITAAATRYKEFIRKIFEPTTPAM